MGGGREIKRLRRSPRRVTRVEKINTIQQELIQFKQLIQFEKFNTIRKCKTISNVFGRGSHLFQLSPGCSRDHPSPSTRVLAPPARSKLRGRIAGVRLHKGGEVLLPDLVSTHLQPKYISPLILPSSRTLRPSLHLHRMHLYVAHFWM